MVWLQTCLVFLISHNALQFSCIVRQHILKHVHVHVTMPLWYCCTGDSHSFQRAVRLQLQGSEDLLTQKMKALLSCLLVHYAGHMLHMAEKKILISLKPQQGYMLIVFIWTQHHWKILVTKYTLLNSTYCWPCISIHPRNENQLDALFILSLFPHSTSTCFGHIRSLSSGGILYIYNNCYVLRFAVDCLLSELGRNSDNRQSTAKHNMYQLLYIYSIPPDDGLQICLKHVEVDDKINWE